MEGFFVVDPGIKTGRELTTARLNDMMKALNLFRGDLPRITCLALS
jgi:hypothetical protein